jgi:type IV pilus assembly protein PilC
MLYRFVASTAENKIVRDRVIAKSKEQARSILEDQELEVQKISIDLKALFSDQTLGRFGGVSVRDKLVFTRNLALMIRAGINIDDALVILAEQSTSSRMRRVLTRVEEEVATGKSLSESISQFPAVFDDLFIKIIFAAEQAGTLSESLEQLATHIKRQYDLRSKIMSAMFYPLLVVISSLVISIALSIFVLPKITSLFRSFDQELPFTTRMIINFSKFMSEQTGLGIAIFAAAGILGYILIKSKTLRPFWEYTLFRMPSIGKIVRDFNLALFARTMATLIVSGVPMTQAVAITTETMRNTRYRRALTKIAELQQSGESLGYLLSTRKDLFPPLVERMIKVGEQSGNLEESLVFLAEFHEEELDYATKNISTIAEPLLIIFVGFIVAVLALAIITPIYQITGSFQVR